MSGVLTALQAAEVLFGGVNSSVTLGPFIFNGMEVPEKITIGGKQAITVHQLIGGGHVIDAMGRDDAPLTWSGYLLDGDALSRALQLDALRVAGQQLTLAWSVFNYSVVIEEFKADFERANLIPYSITVQVVADNSNQPSSAPPSLFDTVNNDINSALGFETSLTNDLATAQGFLAAAGATSKGSAAFNAAFGALNTANDALTGAASASDLAFGVMTDAASSSPGVLPSGTGPLAAISALSSMVTQSAAGAALQQASGYTGRALTNLLNAST